MKENDISKDGWPGAQPRYSRDAPVKPLEHTVDNKEENENHLRLDVPASRSSQPFRLAQSIS